MPHRLWSEALHVTDGSAADALSHPFQRHLVLSLIGREASVSELVAESGRPMSSVHYHVLRLAGLGLLKVGSSAPRGGRAVKRYTAAAPAFFVPYELTGNSVGARLDAELRTELDRGAESKGVLFYRNDRGAMSMRTVVSDCGNKRVAADIWRIVEVDEETVIRVAAELDRILQDAELNPGAGRRRKYLVRCAVVRRDQDELFEP